MTTAVDEIAVAEAAARLADARETRTPCPPVRDLIGRDDIAAAYAVQQVATNKRKAVGGRVIGHKIGLTSPSVQSQLGVDRPDFGVLFHDMEVSDGARIPFELLLQPKIEAEVAFVLSEDLDEPNLDLERVRSAVAGVHAALEIVDSRIAGWDISFGDTVADNGSSGLFVLGPLKRTLAEVEPKSVQMTMRRGGDEVVSRGTGADCLGDPIEALAWLARAAQHHAEPLLAGQIVLSGALGPMVSVSADDTFVASITGLGQVTVSFGPVRAATGGELA